MLKPMRLAPFVIVAAVCGCGGGGGSSNDPGPGKSYPFVTPSVGKVATIAETVVDNANNTINLSYTSTVTSVNPDGSFVTLTEDPAHNKVIVDGTDYSVATTTHDLNASDQETSNTRTDAGGTVVTCTYSPHGVGPDSPLTIGQNWTLQFTSACGSAPLRTATQTGTVVDLESVTAPAGTYLALRLVSTVLYTDSSGGQVTETITNWRDTVTGGSVKQLITLSYGAPLPSTGYPVSREIVVQSLR